MAPPRKKASTKRSARSGPAEPAGPSIAGGRAPSTLTASEVLDYAGSERAREILARSVAFRRSLRPQDIEVIGASSLFRAALAIGRGPPPTVPSAAHWLAEWLARSASTEKIDHWLNTVRVDDPASLDLPLTNSAAAALGRAVTLARLTLERDQFETRHLVAALLLPAGEQMSAAIKEDLDQFGAPAESFLKELVSRIQSNPDAMERLHLDVWEAVAKGEFKDPPTQLIASPRAFLTDYASDVATGQDELGIYADVRSIAELICLREAPPPLSVGLFGNWGSGKSFFMHLLQQEVDRLSQEAKAPRPNGKGPSPFVGNVVQIQFNAWHYADANLWASLTAEFFDQLRVGGFRGSGAATHAALIRQVGEHIKSLESDTARIEHDAQALEQKARSLADAVARSEQALARTEVELIGRHVGQEVGKLLEDNKDQIDEIGARLYGAQNFAGTARFTAAVAELKETSAKLALIGQALVAGGWPTWTAGAGVLALAVFVLVRTTDPSAVLQVANKLAVQTASLSASLAALLTALWGAYRFVRPMLDGAAAFARDLAEEKKRRADRLAQAQDELATLQAEVENAREKADSARRKLSPYRDFDKGRAHGTILKYFLFEDAETKEYEKHIGLVSRARRTFQKLDEIIRAQRLKPAGRQELAVPDRIILYIDDLDRCRNEQVVRVLEAVHLLLAFESIVVVVGVDARWIRAALAKYYQGEFAAAQAAPADWARDSQTATPEDYLEKIFQIPFWLQPFARDPTRSYAGFINALTRKTEGGPGAGRGAGTKTAGAAGKSQAADTAQTTAASVAAAASANERLALSEGEVAVLAALAPMAGDTPRAIKRFVNLYRLIRARQRGADFDRFVGRSGARATYPAVAFLLAFETGQPPRMIELMHDIVAVGQGKLTAALRDAIAAAEKAIGEAALSEPDVRPASAPAGPAMQPADADGVSRRPAPLQSRLALLRSVEAELARVAKSASDAVQAIAEIESSDLRDQLPAVRRYSFHHHD